MEEQLLKADIKACKEETIPSVQHGVLLPHKIQHCAPYAAVLSEETASTI